MGLITIYHIIIAFFKAVFGIDKTIKGSTQFNFITGLIPNISGKSLESVLYEDEEFIVFLPAGKNPGHWNNVNSPTDLMSLHHILVVPKKRKFNAVSLTKDDIPMLFQMKDIGEKVMNYLLSLPDETPLSSNWMMNGGIDGVNMQQKMSYYRRPDDEKICFFFHIYPNYSVDGLHMHVCSSKHLTIGYDKHCSKNINVDSIILTLDNTFENRFRCPHRIRYNKAKEAFRQSYFYYCVMFWEMNNTTRYLIRITLLTILTCIIYFIMK